MSMVTRSREQRAEAAVRSYPSKLYVETATRCNLACPMCVKQARDAHEAEGLLSQEVFEQIQPVLPRLDALILNGIGEPLLNPYLETFISSAKASMPVNSWAGFQSNGLLINQDRALRLVAAGLDKICISLDSVDPARYRSYRTGGEFERVEQAFSFLQRAKNYSSRASLQVGIEFVVMRDNLPELPLVLQWAADRGAAFAIVTHLLPYQESMVSQTLFHGNTDAALKLFTKWKVKGQNEGIDISLYPDVYLKYEKTPEEWRIFDLVEAMKAEACSQGVFLHLGSLFQRGDERAEDLQSVFDEARSIAAKNGMEMRLPEAVPRSERTCEFVEEGGAFISWNGAVHPCYFLWHRYRCFIDGNPKFVRPKVFGNIRDRTLLDIWNSSDYSAFRRNVIRYDYPFCFNCGFALCDYVQGEDFQQDCYVNTEPCAACLWCMGVFHCLR